MEFASGKEALDVAWSCREHDQLPLDRLPGFGHELPWGRIVRALQGMIG